MSCLITDYLIFILIIKKNCLPFSLFWAAAALFVNLHRRLCPVPAAGRLFPAIASAGSASSLAPFFYALPLLSASSLVPLFYALPLPCQLNAGWLDMAARSWIWLEGSQT